MRYPDPNAIEADIYRTQDEMSATFDALMDRLHPMQMIQSAFSGDGARTSSQLLSKAKHNPLALGLIGAGIAWLMSSHNAEPASFRSGRDSRLDDDGFDDPHLLYVRHMMTIEPRRDETPAAYQARRDAGRATFLMVERNADEDESSFRSRLDEAAHGLKARAASLKHMVQDGVQGVGHGVGKGARAVGSGAHAVSSGASAAAHGVGAVGHGVGHAASSTMHGAAGSVAGTSRRAAEGIGAFYRDNPLVAGLIAAAAGAAMGAATPMTAAENRRLGEAGRRARREMEHQADRAMERAEETLSTGREQAEPRTATPNGGTGGDGGVSYPAGENQPIV
jgi:hypothetical protein